MSVSALLPVRNGSEYLEELIPSILGMLHELDEFVILNDGSTDSSGEILDKWEKLDSRIKIETISGGGLIPALNLGLQIARNPWIARFDVDDRYPPNRLQEQRNFIRDDVAVIFTDYNFISSTGHGLGQVHSAIFPSATALSLVSSQRTAHPSALINRELLIRAGGYLLDDFPAEDLALWLRLSKIGSLISVPEILLHYRLTGKSISSRNRVLQLEKKNEIIRAFSGWEIPYIESRRNINVTLEKYLKTIGGEFRIFLHLRDLKLTEKLLGLPRINVNLIRILGLKRSIKVYLAGFSLILDVFLRRLYRFAYKYFN